MSRLIVFKLPGTNSIVIRQVGKREFFLSTDNLINISISNLAALIKYLVKNNLMSIKVLKGIISELEE